MSMNVDEVVDSIVGKVATQTAKAFGAESMSIKLATLWAKELGYISANLGRSGGHTPTTAGLNFGGFDVAEFEAGQEKAKKLASLERKAANLEKKRQAILSGVVETEENETVSATETATETAVSA